MTDAAVIPPTVPVAPPKVAVIAVHGVAYHAPGASAQAMADLLLSLPTEQPSDPRHYSAFAGETIHVPLQPVLVWQYPMRGPRFLAFLQERSAHFAAYLGQRARATGAAVARGSIGHEFMRLLLRDYNGGADGDTYVTTRLKGKRGATAPGGEADVHIYEAYWADLARPKNTLLSFFLALFQLLLHLGSLGRLAIDTGAAENPGPLWGAFRKAQEYAVRMLQLPIPLLNLILFIAAFAVLPQQIPDGKRVIVALVLAGMVGIAFGFLVWHKPERGVPRGPVCWALLPLVFFGVGVIIGFVCLTWIVSPLTVAAVEWWLLGAALLKYCLDKYDTVRKGTRQIGWSFYGVSFAAFLLALAMTQGTATPLGQATLWTMQWLLAALRFFWIVLFACAFAACILGSMAWRTLPKASSMRARARAAVHTSRLALALPTVLVLLLIIFLWGGLFQWATNPGPFPKPLFEEVRPTLAPGGHRLKLLFFNPGDIPALLPDAPPERREITANNYFAGSLVWSVGPSLAITLAATLVAFFLLTWWALPSVLTERFPLRSEKAPPRWSTNGESLHMGAWLSRGLDATRIITFLLWCAVFLVPTVFGIWGYVQPDALTLTRMNGWTGLIVGQTGKLTASLAVLGLIVRYTSSALGIVLDVDNYLRTWPEGATPRAKIAERYVSLLRYIAAYQDDKGRGYGSVVIVAHSLGSLISVDLLRFLREESDEGLARLGYGVPGGNPPAIPIILFTMGNPSRQLLNRFFPYLYDWVREAPDNGLCPLGDATLTPPVPIPADALPDPRELGVQRWVNAYRSGDYVGRSLWLDEWYGRNLNGADQGTPNQPVYVVPQAPPLPLARYEMCIFTGAHQHYWDDTAPDIAQQLSSFIS